MADNTNLSQHSEIVSQILDSTESRQLLVDDLSLEILNWG